MQGRRRALAMLLLGSAACAGGREDLAICARDFDDWEPAQHGGFSRDIVARAIRPGLTAARDRLCACYREVGGEWPERARFRIASVPATGMARVRLEEAGPWFERTWTAPDAPVRTSPPAYPAVERCLAEHGVSFPSFPLQGDLIGKDGNAGPAELVYPVVLEVKPRPAAVTLPCFPALAAGTAVATASGEVLLPEGFHLHPFAEDRGQSVEATNAVLCASEREIYVHGRRIDVPASDGGALVVPALLAALASRPPGDDVLYVALATSVPVDLADRIFITAGQASYGRFRELALSEGDAPELRAMEVAAPPIGAVASDRTREECLQARAERLAEAAEERSLPAPGRPSEREAMRGGLARSFAEPPAPGTRLGLLLGSSLPLAELDPACPGAVEIHVRRDQVELRLAPDLRSPPSPASVIAGPPSLASPEALRAATADVCTSLESADAAGTVDRTWVPAIVVAGEGVPEGDARAFARRLLFETRFLPCRLTMPLP